MKAVKVKDVYAEIFNSQQDLHAYLKRKNPIFDKWRDYIAPDYHPSNPSWQGYTSGEQLMSDFLACRCDPSSIKRVARGIMADNRPATRRVKYYTVAGGIPIVPRILDDEPLYRLDIRRMKAPAKVIDMYVAINVSGSVDREQLEEAGRAVIAEVLAMERNGYRINLYVSKANHNDPAHGSRNRSLLILKVKDAGQAMNVARVAYPLINASFFRGISFGWYQRAPFQHDSGFGSPMGGESFAQALRDIGVGNAVSVALSDIVRNPSDARRQIELQVKR